MPQFPTPSPLPSPAPALCGLDSSANQEAEKPSVAKEFAKVLKLNTTSKDGYLESEKAIVTWCVGHLVNMSYPEAYDENLKRWSFDTIPFIPTEYNLNSSLFVA